MRRIALASMSAFAAILAVVWVTQAVTRIDIATGSAASIGAFVTMMLLLVPQFAALTLPFGLLIGIINVFNAMNADSEMPVMSGSGFSRMRMARPVLVLSLIFGAAIFLINHFVEPAANRGVRDILTDARSNLLATLIQEGRFVQIQEGLTVHVDRKRPGNLLTGVMVVDDRDETVQIIQYAAEAVVDESTGVPLLLMRDGQIHRVEAENGNVSIIQFDAYALSLAQLSRTGTPDYLLRERDTPYLFNPDPNDRHANNWPGQVSGELNRRMTEWLYAPLFALVALVLAGQTRSHRATSIAAVLLGFGAGLGYRWGGYLAYNMVRADGSLVWLLYAIPLAGIGICLIMFITGRTVQVPDRLVIGIERLGDALKRRVGRIQNAGDSLADRSEQPQTAQIASGISRGGTLQRYIFRRLLRAVVILCLGAAALVLLVDFTELSNRTRNLSEYTALTALMVSALRVPFVVQIALPFMMLFATVATLIALNRKYELVVARAAGVSAWQFLRPTWFVALVVGLFGTVILNPIAAAGFSTAETIEGSWRGNPPSRLFGQHSPWLRQAREDGGIYIINAERVAGETVTLFDAMFLEVGQDDRIVAHHRVAKAELTPESWVLEDVTTYAANARPVERTQMLVPTTLDQSVTRQALVRPEMVSIFALPRHIDAVRSFGVPANPFRMQFHSLVALPALLVAMALIAATVSLRFARFGQSAGMILGGIAAGFVLYVVTALAQSFGGAGALPPLFAAWLPVICGILYGAGYLLYREDG